MLEKPEAQQASACFQSTPKKEQLNIVCLPQAGGDTSVYNRWKAKLPPAAAIFPSRLPGRGMRFQEPAINCMDCLTDQILGAMTPFLQTPYVILGSSMGAWIGYNLCLEIEKACLPLPRLLVVCASTTPFNRRPLPFVDTDDRDLLVREVLAFNPDFERAVEYDELLDLLLPTIKADFQLCGRWRPEEKKQVSTPIFAFAGSQDRLVETAEMRDWEQLTKGDFGLEVVPGDHFFIEDPPEPLTAFLSRQANILVQKPAGLQA